MSYKSVNYPISVPVSAYCWDGKCVCDQFSNEGGHATCSLDFWPKTEKSTGHILKDNECRKLLEP